MTGGFLEESKERGLGLFFLVDTRMVIEDTGDRENICDRSR